ncbi:hypothetical protein SCLCIDRAFT_9773 [Scleroderma citrinum Foug A]|uniref:DUF6532 domain-containing protein n=1 Tax=Scleroderma citrinum Foug A TaxID=1036808 RepID=A0A0C3DHL9_9AGAM|nr:hypothetical protein SCLCIDRAFT_9773 [Scleroderma citrinum Foug A]
MFCTFQPYPKPMLGEFIALHFAARALRGEEPKLGLSDHNRVDDLVQSGVWAFLEEAPNAAVMMKHAGRETRHYYCERYQEFNKLSLNKIMYEDDLESFKTADVQLCQLEEEVQTQLKSEREADDGGDKDGWSLEDSDDEYFVHQCQRVSSCWQEPLLGPSKFTAWCPSSSPFNPSHDPTPMPPDLYQYASLPFNHGGDGYAASSLATQEYSNDQEGSELARRGCVWSTVWSNPQDDVYFVELANCLVSHLLGVNNSWITDYVKNFKSSARKTLGEITGTFKKIVLSIIKENYGVCLPIVQRNSYSAICEARADKLLNDHNPWHFIDSSKPFNHPTLMSLITDALWPHFGKLYKGFPTGETPNLNPLIAYSSVMLCWAIENLRCGKETDFVNERYVKHYQRVLDWIEEQRLGPDADHITYLVEDILMRGNKILDHHT